MHVLIPVNPLTREFFFCQIPYGVFGLYYILSWSLNLLPSTVSALGLVPNPYKPKSILIPVNPLTQELFFCQIPHGVFGLYYILSWSLILLPSTVSALGLVPNPYKPKSILILVNPLIREHSFCQIPYSAFGLYYILSWSFCQVPLAHLVLYLLLPDTVSASGLFTYFVAAAVSLLPPLMVTPLQVI